MKFFFTDPRPDGVATAKKYPGESANKTDNTTNNHVEWEMSANANTGKRQQETDAYRQKEPSQSSACIFGHEGKEQNSECGKDGDGVARW